jgi:hypothetical protein
VLSLDLKTLWSDVLVITYNNFGSAEFKFSDQLLDFVTKLKVSGHLKHLNLK